MRLYKALGGDGIREKFLPPIAPRSEPLAVIQDLTAPRHVNDLPFHRHLPCNLSFDAAIGPPREQRSSEGAEREPFSVVRRQINSRQPECTAERMTFALVVDISHRKKCRNVESNTWLVGGGHRRSRSCLDGG